MGDAASKKKKNAQSAASAQGDAAEEKVPQASGGNVAENDVATTLAEPPQRTAGDANKPASNMPGTKDKKKNAQSAASAQGDGAEEKAPQASGGNVAENDVATTLAEPPQQTAGEANKPASNMPGTKDALALGARRVFVQFRDDIPFSVTYFGALLYKTSDGHVLVDLDGSGLARQVGFQENDVILSVNNTESSMVDSPQRAILDTLADVGTKIALVVKRHCQHGTFIWYFAFHVGERDGIPAVVNVYSYCIGNEEFLESLFPILTLALPPDFPQIPFVGLYEYKFDIQQTSPIIDASDSRFMQIQNTLADFVTQSVNLNMLQYERVQRIPGAPTPIAISDMVSSTSRSCGCPNEHEGVNHTDCDDDTPICVSGRRPGPLQVVALPSYMTGSAPISGNSMFFFLSANPDDTYFIKNSPDNAGALSMGQSSDGSCTAVLARDDTPLNVVIQK